MKSIIINPDKKPIGNLSSTNIAIEPSTNFGTLPSKKPKIITSQQLEIYRSPQTFINDFILDTLSGFNLETLYGNPLNYYSQSYKEFDTFRETFFDAHPINVNVNDFIRAHENIFNYSIVEGIKSVVPARSTLSDKNSNIGVEIKPTILEKQKYENEEHSLEVNPNLTSGSIIFVENTEYKQTSLVSTYELPKSGSLKRGYVPEGIPTSESDAIIPSLTGSKLELPYTASIKISDSGSSTVVTNLSSSIVNPFSGSISVISEQLLSK